MTDKKRRRGATGTIVRVRGGGGAVRDGRKLLIIVPEADAPDKKVGETARRVCNVTTLVRVVPERNHNIIRPALYNITAVP